MLETKSRTQSDQYVARFASIEKDAVGGAGAWLLPKRKAAMARFAQLGFPTVRHEDWRYTNVAPIAKADVEFETPLINVAPEQLAPFDFQNGQGICLTFVDGRFCASLSRVDPMPAGIRVVSLAEAIKSDAALLEPHLARHANDQEHAFRALNTAFIEDGAFVHVEKNAVIEEPIHLLFASTAKRHAITQPRILIVADVNSQATIVETYAGLAEGTYFTNTLTELIAMDNAVVDHYKVGRESDQAYHVGAIQVHQFRDSAVSSHAVTLGGAIVRNDMNTLLDGEGGDCTFNGLYMLRGVQHVDNHLRVEHAKPHCDSREFFKGVLDEKSHSVFTGRIFVHKGAQKTDAKQTNMNLLLSEDALADSKPQLEIFADDVKCTHGATIGQVDEEAIFYLRSRGLAEPAARSVLTYAFARESLERVRIEPLRAQLERLLFERLPHGELIRETL